MSSHRPVLLVLLVMVVCAFLLVYALGY